MLRCSERMSRTVENLVNALARGIVTDEGAACNFVTIAETLLDDGHPASADAMLRLSHHPRIRALEGRGNLTALRYVNETSDTNRSEPIFFKAGSLSRASSRCRQGDRPDRTQLPRVQHN